MVNGLVVTLLKHSKHLMQLVSFTHKQTVKVLSNIHTTMNGTHLQQPGLRILPGTDPPTFQLADQLLCLLSHSYLTDSWTDVDWYFFIKCHLKQGWVKMTAKWYMNKIKGDHIIRLVKYELFSKLKAQLKWPNNDKWTKITYKRVF